MLQRRAPDIQTISPRVRDAQCVGTNPERDNHHHHDAALDEKLIRGHCYIQRLCLKMCSVCVYSVARSPGSSALIQHTHARVSQLGTEIDCTVRPSYAIPVGRSGTAVPLPWRATLRLLAMVSSKRKERNGLPPMPIHFKTRRNVFLVRGIRRFFIEEKSKRQY